MECTGYIVDGSTVYRGWERGDLCYFTLFDFVFMDMLKIRPPYYTTMPNAAIYRGLTTNK